MRNFTPFKLYFLLGFMFSVVVSNAQITIVASDFDRMLELGAKVTTYLDTTTTALDVGSSGQFSLDYSGLITNSTFDTESKTVAGSPYQSEFPGAEYVSNYEGVFAGVYSNTWVYNSVTDNFLTHGTGTVAQASSGDIKTIISYSPAWVQYDLPVNLNDQTSYSGTQTIKTITTIPGFGDYTSTIVQDVTITQDVNGYGTVKLPGGKQVNVLRIIEKSTFDYNGTISTSTVIKLFSNTGEIISITPSSDATLEGEIAIENVSWTSGDGGQVVEETPTAPAELSTQAGQNSISLSWVDNSNNETGFYIERSGGTSGNTVVIADIKSLVADDFSVIDSTAANVTTYTDVNVVPGVEYSYRVRAYNESGASAYSPVITGMIAAEEVTAPDNLAIIASTSDLQLSWNDNSDNELGFYIERSDDGGDFMLIDSVAANVTAYSDTSLVVGILYAYRVQAYSEYSASEYSSSANGSLMVAAVTSPDNLSANTTENSVELSWTDNSDNELGFYIERSEEGGEYVVIDSVSADITMYTDTTLAVNVEYMYRVRGYSEYISSDYSNTVTVLIQPTAIEAVFGTSELVLKQNYPNPFRSKTTITFNTPRAENLTLSVFNVDGRLVKTLVNRYVQKGEHRVEFNAESLQNGTYYYQLKSNDRIESRSMLLIK